MDFQLIFRYSLSAALFAAVACVLWLAAYFLPRRRRGARSCARERLYLCLTAYLAALVQIIALRIGLKPVQWLGGSLRLVPLQTTLQQAQLGMGALIYHVGGNLIWFVPLGILLPGLSARWSAARVLFGGAALSLLVECAQFLLGTGISDIDDVLLNVLGALVGYGLRRLCLQIKQK